MLIVSYTFINHPGCRPLNMSKLLSGLRDGFKLIKVATPNTHLNSIFTSFPSMATFISAVDSGKGFSCKTVEIGNESSQLNREHMFNAIPDASSKHHLNSSAKLCFHFISMFVRATCKLVFTNDERTTQTEIK